MVLSSRARAPPHRHQIGAPRGGRQDARHRRSPPDPDTTAARRPGVPVRPWRLLIHNTHPHSHRSVCRRGHPARVRPAKPSQAPARWHAREGAPPCGGRRATLKMHRCTPSQALNRSISTNHLPSTLIACQQSIDHHPPLAAFVPLAGPAPRARPPTSRRPDRARSRDGCCLRQVRLFWPWHLTPRALAQPDAHPPPPGARVARSPAGADFASKQPPPHGRRPRQALALPLASRLSPHPSTGPLSPPPSRPAPSSSPTPHHHPPLLFAPSRSGGLEALSRASHRSNSKHGATASSSRQVCPSARRARASSVVRRSERPWLWLRASASRPTFAASLPPPRTTQVHRNSRHDRNAGPRSAGAARRHEPHRGRAHASRPCCAAAGRFDPSEQNSARVLAAWHSDDDEFNAGPSTDEAAASWAPSRDQEEPR